MSDEDLEVLITLDDPWYGPDEDIFKHLQPITGWPGQPFPEIEESDRSSTSEGVRL